MGAKLWIQDRNLTEEGHNVYRSTSPMDPNNMPAPYAANLPADLTKWEDGAMVAGQTYYYRVGAFTAGGTVELISDEIALEAVQKPYPIAGLVSHLPLDVVVNGEVIDLVGNAPGVVYGGVSAVGDPPFAGVLDFDNEPTTGPDYVVANLPQGTLKTLSLSAAIWFKTTTTKAQAIWNNTANYGGSRSYRGIVVFGSELTGVSRDAYATYRETPRFSNINDNKWHLAVFQQDGPTIRIFLDGGSNMREFTMSSSLDYGSYVDEVVLAATRITGGTISAAADIRLAEQKVYNRILTPQEIDLLYSQFGGVV